MSHSLTGTDNLIHSAILCHNQRTDQRMPRRAAHGTVHSVPPVSACKRARSPITHLPRPRRQTQPQTALQNQTACGERKFSACSVLVRASVFHMLRNRSLKNKRASHGAMLLRKSVLCKQFDCERMQLSLTRTGAQRGVENGLKTGAVHIPMHGKEESADNDKVALIQCCQQAVSWTRAQWHAYAQVTLYVGKA